MKDLFILLVAVAISMSCFGQSATTISTTQFRNLFVSGAHTVDVKTDIVDSNLTGLWVKATSTDASKGVFGVIGIATSAQNIEDIQSGVGVYGKGTDADGQGFGVVADGDLGYTGDLGQVSDIRFKENVNRLPSALDKLMRLEAKQYTFKQGFAINLPKGIRAGFVAQDVREIFPEMVKEKAMIFPDNGSSTQARTKLEGKFLMMNYVALIPYIVSGMQEQQKIITKQTELINSLLEKNGVSNGSEGLPRILSMSPNPAKSILEIVCATGGKPGTIYIYDMNGGVFKTIQLGENNTTIVPLDSFASGVYVTALFVNGAAMDTKRLVVEK